MTVRSTYALDPETVGIIADLAGKWGVSRSEVLRRAVRSAKKTAGNDRLRALDEIHALNDLSPEMIEKWADDVRKERRAWRRPL